MLQAQTQTKVLTPDAPKDNKKTIIIIVVIVAAVMLLCTCCCASYFGYQYYKANSEQPIPVI